VCHDSCTATHCNTLQHTATHRNTPEQHTATHWYTHAPKTCSPCSCVRVCHHSCTATHCNKLRHTATHCYSTLQHTYTMNMLTLLTCVCVPSPLYVSAIPHTQSPVQSPHCNTLLRIETYCNTLQHTHIHKLMWSHHVATHFNTHRNTLQHTATHCNTIQHTL